MCSCHVVYRVNQAEYVIRTLLAALQKYMDTYSTHRVFKLSGVLLPCEPCADVPRCPGQVRTMAARRRQLAAVPARQLAPRGAAAGLAAPAPKDRIPVGGQRVTLFLRVKVRVNP